MQNYAPKRKVVEILRGDTAKDTRRVSSHNSKRGYILQINSQFYVKVENTRAEIKTHINVQGQVDNNIPWLQ